MIENTNDLPRLPHNWIWTTTSEVCSSVRDGTHETPRYVENGVPLITSKNLKPSGLDFATAKNISLEDHQKIIIRSGVDDGDVLFAMIGTIGNPVVVYTKKAFSIKNVALFKKNESFIKPEYLKYWLENPVFKKLLEEKELLRGTTQKFIPLENLRILPVPLAPFDEQVRIAARVEELFARLDAGVEGCRKVKAQLKRYRQAVLKYAFEGKLTEEWRKTHKDQIEPATELLQRIKQERKKDPKYEEPPPIDEFDLPKIPENWMWTTIGSLFDIGSGGTPSRRKPEYWAGNIPWVSSGEVAFCEIWSTNEYITKEGLENSSAKLYPEGTVLMALYGEGKTRGQTAILRIAATTNQAIACIRCTNSPVPPEYVYWWLYYRYYETRRIREGANQPNMYLHHVRRMTIPVPPLLEQKEIIQKIEKSLSVADEIDRTVDTSLLQAGRLRQCILKTTFEGKLVSQDPSNEPAEKLLERIKAERAKSKGEKSTDRKKNKPKQLELSTYVE